MQIHASLPNDSVNVEPKTAAEVVYVSRPARRRILKRRHETAMKARAQDRQNQSIARSIAGEVLEDADFNDLEAVASKCTFLNKLLA